MKILIVRHPAVPFANGVSTRARLLEGLTPILQGQEISVFDETFAENKLDCTYAELQQSLRDNGFSGLGEDEIWQVADIFSEVLNINFGDWIIVDDFISDEYTLGVIIKTMGKNQSVIIFEYCDLATIPLEHQESYQKLRSACIATTSTFASDDLDYFLIQMRKCVNPSIPSEDPALVGLTEQ